MATAAEVIHALKAIQSSGRLDVTGIKEVSDSVLKFDEVSFRNQSTLMLSNLDAAYIAIAIKRLILDINNPEYRACISRPIGIVEQKVLVALDGHNGAAGDNGNHATVAIDRAGQPGEGGNEGKLGGYGKTKELPSYFIFVQDFVFGRGTTPSRQYFNFYFEGFRGGHGGMGGPGGNGGNGSWGEQGATGLFDCLNGPGAGGDGGDAGRGGLGGDAGRGGKGGYLFLFGPDRSIFDFTTANIEGGRPGLPGAGGPTGRPGKGGRGGGQHGHCWKGVEGNDGQIPSPSSVGNGSTALPGARGAEYIGCRDNSDLFI